MGNDTSIDYIIRHVFLPPGLPQKDDENVEKGTCLIEAVLAALILFQQKHVSEQEEKEERAEWSACIKMVESMLELRNQYGGGLAADRLSEKLSGMTDGGKLETTRKFDPQSSLSFLSFLSFLLNKRKRKEKKEFQSWLTSFVLAFCFVFFFCRYPGTTSRLSECRPHHTKTFRRICIRVI